MAGHRPSPATTEAFAAPWWMWQVPTTLLGATTCVLVALGGADRLSVVLCAGAVAAMVLVTVAASAGLVVDGRRWWTLPVLDAAAAAVLHATASSATWSGILLVGLPVAWLAYSFGTRGVVLAVGLVAAVAAAPFVAHRPTGDDVLLDAVLPALALAGMAVVTYGASRALTAARSELVARSAALELQLLTNESVLGAVDVGVAVFVPGRRPVLNELARDFYRRSRERAVPGDDPDSRSRGHVYDLDRTTRLPPEAQAHHRAVAGESFSGLLQWLGEPGRQIAVVCSARQMRGADGVVRGTVLSGWDATDLLDSMRVREEFLSTVSHELRTPLTSVVGYLETLEDQLRAPGTGAPEAALRHLAAAQRNAAALHARVEQLLDEGRTGHGPLHTAPTDVVSLLRGGVARHREAAERAGLSFAFSAPPSLTATVDPTALDRVVDNLLTNAVKYTDRGRIEVDLRPVGAAAGGAFVLTVSDTGVGMDDTEVRHAFERFYRADHAGREAIPGIGIGLAVTKRLVEAHGGTITLLSRPGDGSVFEVRIPCGAGTSDDGPTRAGAGNPTGAVRS